MNLQKLIKISFWAFLISLPFGYRRLIYQFTFGFDEYEAIFLYASDIFLLLFLGLFAFYVFQSKTQISNLKNSSLFYSLLSIFLLTAAISLFLAQYQLLAFYNFARLLLLALTAFAVALLVRDGIVKLQNIFTVTAGLAVAQSLIAFLQFVRQESLGLWFLGESVLSPFIGGAAKIPVGGGVLLRGYGTFPHPNVLAAFLIIGFLSLYYFWLRRASKLKLFSSGKNLWSDIYLGVGIFVVAYGLVLAFSRAGWFILDVANVFVLAFALINKNHRLQGVRLIILLTSIAILLYMTMGWAIFPRAKIPINEPAVTYRLAYNELGLHLIGKNPFGIGIGNQVIYSVKNSVYKMFGMNERWQWQPIHNIYLLMASEIGILGLAAFLAFAGTLIWRAINNDLENIIVVAVLSSLLLVGFVDHFLWTLQPGRLMLWLAIGIVVGFANGYSSVSPRSSMDRTPASGAGNGSSNLPEGTSKEGMLNHVYQHSYNFGG